MTERAENIIDNLVAGAQLVGEFCQANYDILGRAGHQRTDYQWCLKRIRRSFEAMHAQHIIQVRRGDVRRKNDIIEFSGRRLLDSSMKDFDDSLAMGQTLTGGVEQLDRGREQRITG